MKLSSRQIIERKIHDRQSLEKLLAVQRFKEKKVVFTNGCFDLLHLGHIDYLSKAADLGDFLIIGLNTDESVRKLKGKKRPITDENSRAHILASLLFVNAVILFQEDTPYNLISWIKPDVLVKGADYNIEEIAGHDIVFKNGGDVKTIELLPGYSTTAIEEKIKS